MELIRTSEKVEVKDYPYGYTLRTTLFDTIEFSPKKGYRHVTQTINPKNGRLNAPKKSTYYPFKARFYNEDNHIKTISFSFNGDSSVNRAAKFIAEHFQYFTENEIVYFYDAILTNNLISFKFGVLYDHADADSLKPYYTPIMDICKKGIADKQNYFADIFIDEEKIKALKR